MRRQSHIAMGRFLLRTYLPNLPRQYARLFLLGCIEPDGNPATYLKGSIRAQWFQGHNFSNASPFLFRLTQRLERKTAFSAWDYYSLGKAIHYTLDAFTYPHNRHFGKGLSHHRIYEVKLQLYFLSRLHSFRPEAADVPDSAAGYLRKMHEKYLLEPGCVETDTSYALRVSCALIRKLTENVPQCQPQIVPFLEKDGVLIAP